MSEFQSDIKDRKYDEEGNELDKHGFKIKTYPGGVDSVYRSVANCENLCGLDRNLMAEILKGKWSESTTSNHAGRTSKKIVIEYNIKEKSDD
jgi:hypothetical protein